MNRILACFAVVLLACGVQAQGSGGLNKTVQTANGRLHGVAADAQGVLAFRGIPFAAPPVGELRWRAPEPAKPWQGLREATSYGSRCWELGLPERTGADAPNEDCLYLNVWTAANSARERRPVMVWIHGGGFEFGNAHDPQSDGTLFAEKGVVLVSINYRLGVFGFFADPLLRSEGRLSSNFGILDQIAALKWVQANIANFGGDPKNVTIFGVSSGSQSVSILMTSPLTKGLGLFQRAIGESGSSLQQLPTVQEMAMRGAGYAGALQAKSIADLRAMPAQTLNRAAPWNFRERGDPPVFAPSVDQVVIPSQLDEVFRKGEQSDVPLLAGFNRREDFPFLPSALPHATAAEFRATALIDFGPERYKEFLKLYPTGTDAEAKTSAEELLADSRQSGETWRWLSLESKTGKAAVYGYVFGYVSPYAPIPTHAGEVPFVFGNLVTSSFVAKTAAPGPADRAMSNKLMAYWINFATRGDPNGTNLPHWPGFRQGSAMLQIQPDGSVVASPLSPRQVARFKFLDDYLISASMGNR